MFGSNKCQILASAVGEKAGREDKAKGPDQMPGERTGEQARP